MGPGRVPAIARRAAMLAVSLALVAPAGFLPLQAKVYMTQDEALKVAFPGQEAPERLTDYLTAEQAAAVETASGQPLASRVITWYRRAGITAWFDTHVVRTLPETIMVVVSPAGEVSRVDILSFAEPEEYLPKGRWIEQLHGHALDDGLSLRGEIRPITGATLSARAIVGATRRVLALHRILSRAPGAPAEAPRP